MDICVCQRSSRGPQYNDCHRSSISNRKPRRGSKSVEYRYRSRCLAVLSGMGCGCLFARGVARIPANFRRVGSNLMVEIDSRTSNQKDLWIDIAAESDATGCFPKKDSNLGGRSWLITGANSNRGVFKSLVNQSMYQSGNGTSEWMGAFDSSG